MQKPSESAANRRHQFSTIAAVSAVFVVTVLCYWPSLDGPFFFDDVPNLEILGDRGGLSSFDDYVEFVVSAQAGPLGRPVSLASFALNGQTWPTDPRPFRVTNLIIHLVNGLLVLFLARQLFATVYNRETATRLALLCLALWMLHPLLVSTTAYVIQRMTQLASLFILTGLICYIRGRKILPERPGQGWAWIILGMGASGTLAVLSKESGILLPFYALVIELTVFSSSTIDRRSKNILVGLLCLPLLAILSYLTLNWDGLKLGFEFRPFSMQERLLTQAPVLVDYLHQVVAPHMSGLGIIHDDYPISKGLLDPPTTLLSVVFLVTLLVLAIWSRKRWPLASLGILWFFAGHSLEAGPLSLELYFDHRNYLPLLGPLLAICSLLPTLPGELRRVAPIVIGLFLCLELFLTWQSARLWSDEDLMMRTAFIDHPASLRVQQYAGNQHILAGDYKTALEIQESIAAGAPEHTTARLSMLNLRCLLGELTVEQVSETQQLLVRGRHDPHITNFLGVLLANVTDGSCEEFGMSEYQAVLDALLRNPVLMKSKKTRGAAHYFKGIAFASEEHIDNALEQFDLSFDAVPEIDIRLRQIILLLQRGRVDDARRYLDLTLQYREARFWRSRLREADLDLLQQQIEAAGQQELR